MNKHQKKRQDNILVFLFLCLLIYGLLCMSGCSVKRAALCTHSDCIKTVTTERIVYRDTAIYIPMPTESEKTMTQDTDTSFLQTSLAESEAFVSGGRLHHFLRNKNKLLQPVNVKIPEKVVRTTNSRLATRTVTVEVERELTRWQKLLQALGLGTFVALCAALLYMAVRIVRKLM